MSDCVQIEIIKKSVQLLALIENADPIQDIDKEIRSMQEICFIAEELRSKWNQHVMTWTEDAIKNGACPAELQIYAEEKGWNKWK